MINIRAITFPTFLSGINKAYRILSLDSEIKCSTPNMKSVSEKARIT